MDNQQTMPFSQCWAEAERKVDPNTLKYLVNGDFSLIGPFGFVLNREQWLDRYKTGDLKNESFDWKVEGNKDYGCMAVIQGVQTQKTLDRGQDSSGSFRVSLVAMLHGEADHIAHIQLSGPLMEMGPCLIGVKKPGYAVRSA